jgi:hypothetical protein
MKIPRRLPEHLGFAGFTIQEALDAGVTPVRLRHRSLTAPSRGIRQPVTEVAPVLSEHVRPFTLITEFSAASHATAFSLWAFPGFHPGRIQPLRPAFVWHWRARGYPNRN